MTGFIFKLLLAIVALGVAWFLGTQQGQPTGKNSGGNNDGLLRLGKHALRVFAFCLAVWAIIGTSAVWVPSGKIAIMHRVYFGKSLPPGQIVALDGELGPQARILTAGFHVEFFITMNNNVEFVDIFTVPNGQCAIISAKDGVNQGASAFAEPWKDEDRLRMINDATYFLTVGKGQRGPQSTVLTPGSYTINPFLWEAPKVINATRVEQGTVGVVKSSLQANVDFGGFKHVLDLSKGLRVLTKDKLPEGAAEALLVPVGGIGVWEEPLPNGLYYINTDAYKITMVPTVAQMYEYKGGYTKRTVEIKVNDQGKIEEKPSEVVIEDSKDAADRAIFTKPEGWDVPQELRAIVQIRPEMAPFVVASLGLTQENAKQVIENRVITPIIRSVVRDVLGGSQILFKATHGVLDKDGKQVLNEKGEPKTETVSEFRATKVLDLLDNRGSLEDEIRHRAQPEALKEGVTIQEVRLAESAIPPELLLARKREQLAQQLTKAWAQEEIAQAQRKSTENARAIASQQGELVTAEIANQAAIKRAEARKTEGEGEKQYLINIAEGQKAQASVLGEEQTVKLQMFQQLIKAGTELADKHPEIFTKGLENAQKFVPNVLVNSNGGSGNLEGAAAIFGSLVGNDAIKPGAMTKPSGK